jgi:hypothetical protein
MTNLESRVRHTLHELADTVPHSTDPRAELDRRLARRRTATRPALAVVSAGVVAAAAVVAVVAVPLALDGDSTPPPTVEQGDEPAPPSNYDWPAEVGPHVLGTADRDGERVDAVTWVRAGQVCIGEGRRVPTAGPGSLTDVSCQEVPAAWPYAYPGQPEVQQYVLTMGVLTGPAPHSGPFRHLMFFVTAPQVTTMEVGDWSGAPVEVRLVDANEGARFYVAEFPETTAGLRYTARDANGTALDSAIE